MSIKENLKPYQLQIGVFYVKLVKQASVRRADLIVASTRPASVSVEDRRVQIAAAKTRITLDKKLGLETPDWIIALSKEEPEYNL
jgi:hypothetical protein